MHSLLLHIGQRIWVEIEDFDTGEPHDAYTFEEITRSFLAEGYGRTGSVGKAACYLLDAATLTRYAIAWLEARFGVPA